MKIDAIETKTSVKKLFHIYLASTHYGLGKDRRMVDEYLFRLTKFKSPNKKKKYLFSHEFEVVEFKLKCEIPDKYRCTTQHYYWIGIPEIDFCISSGDELFYNAKHPHEIPIECAFDCEYSSDIIENAAYMQNFIREIKLKDILG
jgi:hypothetical protein